MTEAEALDLMVRFRSAYAKRDRAGLIAATSTDFAWHQHYAVQLAELPHGRILRGVDALLEQLQWRAEHWQDVSYANLVERAAQDVLVQTFRIAGTEDGVAFTADVVDLYPVSDGRITAKDTYWKYLK
ncbi:MAG: nuclear transport factor 2 family protein [Pseudomonadales bacterium]